MTHRNRWFGDLKGWFSIAMLVITRGYFILLLLSGDYPITLLWITQIPLDPHLNCGPQRCHVEMIGSIVPCGKHTKNYGKSPCWMGKSTISMAIFNSYVSLPEGNIPQWRGFQFHVIVRDSIWAYDGLCIVITSDDPNCVGHITSGC